MRSTGRRVADICLALPAALLSGLAGLAGRDQLGANLRQRARRVPTFTWFVTLPFWVVVVVRGVLYPAFGSGNLESSWGGPTLIGAWATHLAIAVAGLVVVSLVLAVLTRSPPSP